MDADEIRTSLLRERTTAQHKLAQLRGDLAEIIAAAVDVATDDEHDPEGATIAYERERTKALIDQTEAHIDELARALDRLDAGSYGICVSCGKPIGEERLQARPVVQTCITCASRS